ncbi:restriction endonuclease [Herbidospora cretacea]|uniref:restriction endonuclease n=1 Tax=Herbidospora cretacea TaxID=28444 RepID=UPI0012DF07F7|nr:restriction endonuclease [Herbidospora cretacea]
MTPGTVSLEDAERDFKRLLVKRDGTVVHGYVLVEEPGPGDSLSFNRYEPALIAQRSALSSFGPTKPLGELFEISMGRFLAPEHVGLMVKVDDPRGIRVIRGRDILRDETIAPVEDDAVYVNFPDDRCLQVGDILIRSIGRLTDFGGLVCAEITESDLPAVADSKVLILRCAAPMPRSQRSIVLQFLRTPLAKKIAYVDEGYHLTIATLKNLPVPQLDDNLLAAWDNLESARTRFDVWRMEADAVLSNIFAGESSKAARSQLISSGRNLRLRSNAAAAMDDESYIFRTRFPYPVAYRWRVMEAEKSAREYKDAYVAVLDTAETLASYIALVSLGLAREAGLNLGYVGNIREKLKRDVGPSFGDWIAILREISKSRAVRSASSSQALSDLRQVAANREADAALGRLADKRNDEAHLRRVASGDLPPAFEDALADLVVLMNAALVVTDIPLVQIVSVQWDSFQRSALVQLREFMGDHSVISSQFIRYPSSELEVGSLYVMDDHRELHLLRPYLVGNDCPKCHMWSTFHVDGASQNFVTMKSLEHGHLFKDENLPNALRHVGLL